MFNHVNYQQLLRGLYYFDCMIKGAAMKESMVKEIKDEDYNLMKQLISYELGSEAKSKKIDDYIIHTFHLFCPNKTQIVLNLFYLDQYFKKLHHLFMQSVERDW